MYISDKKQKHSWQALKTALIYLAAAAVCFTIDQVYSLFGHGVTSSYMSLMFLFPLIGGTAVFLTLWIFVKEADHVPHYRIFYNIYNSGIAALATGGLLKGIFEIAGTSSPYTVIFFLLGCLLVFAGVLGYLLSSLLFTKHIKAKG